MHAPPVQSLVQLCELGAMERGQSAQPRARQGEKQADRRAADAAFCLFCGEQIRQISGLLF